MKRLLCILVLCAAACNSTNPLVQPSRGVVKGIFPMTKRYLAADKSLDPVTRKAAEAAMASFEEAVDAVEAGK